MSTAVPTDATAAATRSVASDPIRDYKERMLKYPLLNAEQEVELGETMELARLAREELETTQPTGAHARELQRLVHAGQVAREQFINSNLRLAFDAAAHVPGATKQPELFLDLIQEANLGIIRAVDKFDYTKGNKFSTYATWWVRQFITRSLPKHSGATQLPDRVHASIRKVNAVTSRITNETGRRPSNEEVGNELGMSAARVEELRRYGAAPVSLNQAVAGVDGDIELGELVADEAVVDPEDEALGNVVVDMLYEALDDIAPAKRQAIAMAYGLQGYTPMHAGEIAAVMGCSREWARKLLASAKDDLRELLRSAGADAGWLSDVA